MKADLKTGPCIALADKLQLIDCALGTAQTQAENCRAEREKLQEELDDARELASELEAKNTRQERCLDESRQQMEADAETARMAREILLCEIRSLKEERDQLKSRITLLEGQRKRTGLFGRLLKGRQP